MTGLNLDPFWSTAARSETDDWAEKNFSYALLICAFAAASPVVDGWDDEPHAASASPATTTIASRLTTRA